MRYLYWFLHIAGVVVGLAYVYGHARRFGLPRWRAVFCGASVYAASYALMLVLYAVVTGNFGGQNVIRVILFIPPLTLFFAEVFRLPKRACLDLFAPVVCLAQAIAKPGCLFVGCCRSWLETSLGIYNRVTGTKLFPVQLGEGLTALMIAVLLIRKACRREKADGVRMAEMLFWFGLTRIGWEYLRESPKYFLGLSELAFWSLGMTAAGLVWMILARRKSMRETERS